jgi:hypothetical protein
LSNEEKPDDKTNRERILDLLEKGDMSQKDIAQTVGVSEALVSAIANEFSIPKEARPFLTEDEATFLQEATPTQMKRRLTQLLLERKGRAFGGGKVVPIPGIPGTEAPEAGRPSKPGYFLQKLNDELERMTGIQVAAQKLGVDPATLMRAAGGDEVSGVIDTIMNDMWKQYRMKWVMKQISELEQPSPSPSDITIKTPSGISLEEVRQLIKDDSASREAQSEKRRLEDELREATHKYEILDQRLNAFLQLEKQAGSRDMNPQAVGELMGAKIEAAIANLDKDFTKGQIDDLKGRLQQLETQPGKKSFMDEIGESLEPKIKDKIGEMIDKGFLSKEEVQDEKTGKVNWGKIVTKTLDMGTKALEKAAAAPPPERTIRQLQPPAGMPAGPNALINPLTGLPVEPVTGSGAIGPSASLISPGPARQEPTGQLQTRKVTMGVESVSQRTTETAASTGPEPESQTTGSLNRKGSPRPTRHARGPVTGKET